MKIKLSFETENEKISQNYRFALLSFFKKCLQKSYPEDYEKFYSAQNPVIKPFTFSVSFSKSEMQKDFVYAPDKFMNVYITGLDEAFIIKLYNSFLKEKFKPYPFPENTITLKKVNFVPQADIKGEKALIKFMSPLIVRIHNGENDRYLDFSDENFNDTLNVNTKAVFEKFGFTGYEPIKIMPLKAKKTVVKSDGLCFNASVGIFSIEGDTRVLSVLYRMGMGSRRSEGFGMFETLGGM